jgi:hypothetical protein
MWGGESGARELVGIESGVVSGVINLESPGVGAPGGRPRQITSLKFKPHLRRHLGNWDHSLECCGSSKASLKRLGQLRLLDRRTASLRTHTSAIQGILKFNANCIFVHYLFIRERGAPSILACLLISNERLTSIVFNRFSASSVARPDSRLLYITVIILRTRASPSVTCELTMASLTSKSELIPFPRGTTSASALNPLDG